MSIGGPHGCAVVVVVLDVGIDLEALIMSSGLLPLSTRTEVEYTGSQRIKHKRKISVSKLFLCSQCSIVAYMDSWKTRG